MIQTEPAPIPETIENGGVIKVYYVKADTPDYTVTITPADITIYTGGDAYGGVTDASGNIIVETDSGLPEPGYHLKLSDDVIDWLNEKINIEGEEDGPRILADYLTFTYSVGRVTRVWDLSYVGVYDVDEETGEPTRYVYSLEPGVDENGEEIPVRLLFKDESGEVAYDDIIGMAENSVCEEYTMSINPGTLTQSEIKAVFTVPGEDPLTCGIAIQPGTLTIRSTTDEEYVNDIGCKRRRHPRRWQRDLLRQRQRCDGGRGPGGAAGGPGVQQRQLQPGDGPGRHGSRHRQQRHRLDPPQRPVL